MLQPLISVGRLKSTSNYWRQHKQPRRRLVDTTNHSSDNQWSKCGARSAGTPRSWRARERDTIRRSGDLAPSAVQGVLRLWSWNISYFTGNVSVLDAIYTSPSTFKPFVMGLRRKLTKVMIQMKNFTRNLGWRASALSSILSRPADLRPCWQLSISHNSAERNLRKYRCSTCSKKYRCSRSTCSKTLGVNADACRRTIQRD